MCMAFENNRIYNVCSALSASSIHMYAYITVALWFKTLTCSTASSVPVIQCTGLHHTPRRRTVNLITGPILHSGGASRVPSIHSKLIRSTLMLRFAQSVISVCLMESVAYHCSACIQSQWHWSSERRFPKNSKNAFLWVRVGTTRRPTRG